MPITGTQNIKLTRKDFLHLREGKNLCVLFSSLVLIAGQRKFTWRHLITISSGHKNCIYTCCCSGIFRSYLLSYLLAVVQVTGSTVPLHKRCFKPKILQMKVKSTDQTKPLVIQHFTCTKSVTEAGAIPRSA